MAIYRSNVSESSGTFHREEGLPLALSLAINRNIKQNAPPIQKVTLARTLRATTYRGQV